MTWLGAFLCWAGLHRPPPGVDPRWSIYFYCDRCGDVRPGDVATRVRTSGRKGRR